MRQSEFISADSARQQGLLERAGSPGPGFRAVLDNSLAYWEIRRLAYNLVLTAIVLGVDLLGPARGELLRYQLLPLVLLAVLANLCYSTAYLPDLVLQYSSYRPLWLRVRPLLFSFGLILAGVLAFNLATAMLLSQVRIS
ncbi:hypothetical protein DYH09_19975 [bacterium CPR1]|nr:hypothetical protein [bacterium CPR1]